MRFDTTGKTTRQICQDLKSYIETRMNVTITFRQAQKDIMIDVAFPKKMGSKYYKVTPAALADRFIPTTIDLMYTILNDWKEMIWKENVWK